MIVVSLTIKKKLLKNLTLLSIKNVSEGNKELIKNTIVRLNQFS